MYTISFRSCAFADACDMVSVRKDGEDNINLSALIKVIGKTDENDILLPFCID